MTSVAEVEPRKRIPFESTFSTEVHQHALGPDGLPQPLSMRHLARITDQERVISDLTLRNKELELDNASTKARLEMVSKVGESSESPFLTYATNTAVEQLKAKVDSLTRDKADLSERLRSQVALEVKAAEDRAARRQGDLVEKLAFERDQKVKEVYEDQQATADQASARVRAVEESYEVRERQTVERHRRREAELEDMLRAQRREVAGKFRLRERELEDKVQDLKEKLADSQRTRNLLQEKASAGQQGHIAAILDKPRGRSRSRSPRARSPHRLTAAAGSLEGAQLDVWQRDLERREAALQREAAAARAEPERLGAVMLDHHAEAQEKLAFATRKMQEEFTFKEKQMAERYDVLLADLEAKQAALACPAPAPAPAKETPAVSAQLQLLREQIEAKDQQVKSLEAARQADLASFEKRLLDLDQDYSRQLADSEDSARDFDARVASAARSRFNAELEAMQQDYRTETRRLREEYDSRESGLLANGLAERMKLQSIVDQLQATRQDAEDQVHSLEFKGQEMQTRWEGYEALWEEKWEKREQLLAERHRVREKDLEAGLVRDKEQVRDVLNRRIAELEQRAEGRPAVAPPSPQPAGNRHLLLANVDQLARERDELIQRLESKDLEWQQRWDVREQDFVRARAAPSPAQKFREKELVSELSTLRQERLPYLGVDVAKNDMHGRGVKVTGVKGPGQEAGLAAGDIIQKITAIHKIHDRTGFRQCAEQLLPGCLILIDVERYNQKRTFSLTVEDRMEHTVASSLPAQTP